MGLKNKLLKIKNFEVITEKIFRKYKYNITGVPYMKITNFNLLKGTTWKQNKKLKKERV